MLAKVGSITLLNQNRFVLKKKVTYKCDNFVNLSNNLPPQGANLGRVKAQRSIIDQLMLYESNAEKEVKTRVITLQNILFSLSLR